MSGEDPELVLDWIAPSLAPTVVIIEDDGADILDTSPEPSTSTHPLDSDNLIAEDDLEDGDDTLIEDDSIIDLASSTISWRLPVSPLLFSLWINIDLT